MEHEIVEKNENILNSDLDKEIAKSQAVLNEAKQVKPKRKYNKTGQYSKDGIVNPLEKPNQNNEVQMQLKPEEVDLVMSDLIKVPFDFAATRLKFSDFKIGNDEALVLGRQLRLIINQYLPNFAGQHPVLIAFITTMGITVYGKITKYNEFKKVEAMKNGNEFNSTGQK